MPAPALTSRRLLGDPTTLLGFQPATHSELRGMVMHVAFELDRLPACLQREEAARLREALVRHAGGTTIAASSLQAIWLEQLRTLLERSLVILPEAP